MPGTASEQREVGNRGHVGGHVCSRHSSPGPSTRTTTRSVVPRVMVFGHRRQGTHPGGQHLARRSSALAKVDLPRLASPRSNTRSTAAPKRRRCSSSASRPRGVAGESRAPLLRLALLHQAADGPVRLSPTGSSVSSAKWGQPTGCARRDTCLGQSGPQRGRRVPGEEFEVHYRQATPEVEVAQECI